MRIGWLHDEAPIRGGAELSQAEFLNGAPKGVEVIESPPGAALSDLDALVVHNCMTYPADAVDRFYGPVIRYHHDLAVAPLDTTLAARHIFCSPLQRSKRRSKGALVPPAIDLDRFRAVRNVKGEGAVCIGRMSYGKGVEFLVEYPEPVDVYSPVPLESRGSLIYKGALEAEEIEDTLAQYERFVFLPDAVEPFGRSVVEAWAAGLDVIVNKNVGAAWWIEEAPEKLDTACEDFWTAVLG